MSDIHPLVRAVHDVTWPHWTHDGTRTVVPNAVHNLWTCDNDDCRQAVDARLDTATCAGCEQPITGCVTVSWAHPSGPTALCSEQCAGRLQDIVDADRRFFTKER